MRRTEMGNRKGTHCDKLVTTVCMLCILCAPHSHCSIHDPQLPRASFHHHGRTKMSRPPDGTDALERFDNGPLQIWQYHDADSQPSTKSSAEPTPLRLSAVTRNNPCDYYSVTDHFKSKHLVPHKRSASSKPDNPSVVPKGGRIRRSGDLPPLGNSHPNMETSPFLDEIFKEFGDGNVITLEGFKKMLSTIGGRKPKSDVSNAEGKNAGFNPEAAAQKGLVNEQAAPVHPCSHSGLKDGRVMFKLPKNLSAPQHASSSNASSFSSQWHCLTAPEILSVADIEIGNGNEVVNRTKFVHHLCPALVYGTLGIVEPWIQDPQPSPSLTRQKDHHSHEHPKDDEVDSMLVPLPSNDPKVWLYASLSVIIISLCGLLGVAVIPVMQQVYYHQLLQFLVALAVGTLCGDALLHLLPHAMTPSPHFKPSHHDFHAEGHHHNHDVNMWKGLGAMLGLVFFFTTERCLILIGDWRKKQQRRKKPIPSRVRVMREAGPSSVVESGMAGQVLNPGSDVLLGPSTCGGSSPRIGLPPGNNSVGEKLCKHKYSSYPYCYGEITTGEIVNESSSAAALEEKSNNQDKKSRQRRRQNGCSESIGEANDDKLEKLMVRDGSSGFVKSPIEAIGRGYLESHPKESEGGEEKKEEEEDEEGGNSYTVILREHERPHHGHSHTHGHVHSAPESISSVAWMVVMGDGLHNLTDGMAIGAAFASGIAGGFSTAVAVFCHELPHELGDFAVLLKAGMTAKQAVFYNLFSSLLCYFGMILGIFLGDTESATQWIFAAAAGMFLYIALVDMVPELTTSHSKEAGSLFQSALQSIGLISGVGVMLIIALYEEDLRDIFSG